MNAPIRLLYAEDNPADADLTRARFSEYAPEFELQIVATGAACLEQIARRPPDILLLDQRLPDTDGLEILKRLFRAAPELPMVLITGAGDEDLVVRALRLGAANYVPKRGDYLETLPDLLHGVLEEWQSRRGEARAGSPRRILYVEHLAMDIELTLRHFAEVAPHFTVDVARSCREAMDRLSRSSCAYDLALIDLRMPDQSGLEFLHDAKARRLRLPPFIMITGGGDDATAIASLKLGAADYIVKRDGYLDQLTYCIEHRIAHEQLCRLNAQFLDELAERKRVVAALRESEECYRRIVETAMEGVWTIDAGACTSFVNPKMAQMFGYEVGEMLGRPLASFMGQEEQELAIRNIERRKQGIAEQHDFEFLRKDGSRFWASLATTPIHDEKGAYAGALAMVTDITERKRAEQEARHLATFPQLNPNPVLEFAADGRLIYFNQAAQAMAELTGYADLLRLLPPETPRIVVGCLESGETRQRVETKHGLRTLSWSFLPISENQVVHCYVNDITDRLRLEDQLRQSQKMEAIGQLASGVAHDFNNLLTVVQFETCSLAVNTSLDAEARESVCQITKAADRAANLTRQLLTFSRKQDKETRPVDLSELIENTTRLLHRILGEDIVLSTHIASGLPLLQADPGMIEQVVMNLTVNSRDAMPAGGRLDLALTEVVISPANIAHHAGGRVGRFLQLDVSDTGTGIASEHLTRIFDPFFTTKEVGKGTGLGLATVFGIVKQHDGWIEVASELGRGTVFRVFLPVDSSIVAQQPCTVVPVLLRGGSETLLVVEDEEAIRSLLQATLERYGYRVLLAQNGPEAVELFIASGLKVDLLLTDMVMPGGMNGRELAQSLLGQLGELKVIYMSGYTSDGVTRDLSLDPGVNWLRKPFSFHSLVELVRRRLDETLRDP